MGRLARVVIARALALIGLDILSACGLPGEARVAQMEASNLTTAIARGATVLDVRNASEWAHGHVDLLQRAGFKDVTNLQGGYTALEAVTR